MEHNAAQPESAGQQNHTGDTPPLSAVGAAAPMGAATPVGGPSPVSETPGLTNALVARLAMVVVFVGIWMALGWQLRLQADAYLLLGVPLTILFQMVVRRAPLRALWVRDAPPLRMDTRWVVTTMALAALPVYQLLTEGAGQDWVSICWMLCAVAGAPIAAYAMQQWNRRAARSIRPVALVVGFMSAFMLLGILTEPGLAVLLHKLRPVSLMFAQSLLLYFPISFVLEEVTFRGALDAHVYRPHDKRGLGSAVMVAMLWGLWHLPIVPAKEALLLVAVRLALLHMLVGIPLALSWRIGGNLVVPAAAHALLDAVRNAAQAVR